MPFELPKLDYDFAALEPYIDAQTMEIHYTKHHQAYVTKLNEALANYPDLLSKSIEELLSSLSSLPEAISKSVRNQGGGHYNHSLFWKILKKNAGQLPAGDLLEAITSKFKTFDTFEEEFTKQALSVFGSGWVWLIMKAGGQIELTTTPNQDSPVSNGQIPILGLDVWEHAYYLKYQNKRPDYIDAWWHVIDWEAVAKRYQQAKDYLSKEY